MSQGERGLTVAVTGPTGTFGFGLIPLLQAETGSTAAFASTHHEASKTTSRAFLIEASRNMLPPCGRNGESVPVKFCYRRRRGAFLARFFPTRNKSLIRAVYTRSMKILLLLLLAAPSFAAGPSKLEKSCRDRYENGSPPRAPSVQPHRG